jgi:hypothetical protein
MMNVRAAAAPMTLKARLARFVLLMRRLDEEERRLGFERIGWRKRSDFIRGFEKYVI